MTEYQRCALALLAIIAGELAVLIVLRFVRRNPPRHLLDYDEEEAS